MKIQSVSSGSVQPNVAGQTPRKVSGQKHTTAPKQVGDNQAARNTQGAPETKPAGTLDPRLASYARNIDSRLKVAIENSANQPREQAALKAAQANFHSMVFRLNEAFLTEGKPKLDMSPGDGMHKVMEHLGNAVKTVLSHGKVDVQG